MKGKTFALKTIGYLVDGFMTFCALEAEFPCTAHLLVRLEIIKTQNSNQVNCKDKHKATTFLQYIYLKK